jgi:signal transduction histidine kinase
MLVVLLVVACFWTVVQIVSTNQIGSVSSIAEVHSSTKNNTEFSDYLGTQKKYEAHFVNLASSIKKLEQERLSKAIGITAIVVFGSGAIAAYVAAKLLMKPVVDSYQSQERFLQDAAHELRNPLATLSVALQQNNSTSPELLGTFRRQTKRLVSITEDLLYIEKQSDSNIQQINLSDLLNDIVEDLSSLASAKSIKLKIITDNNIVKKMSSSDYIKMSKNIIDNAIKYSPNKSKILITQKKSKGRIYLSVQDQGIGIPHADLSKIGDRFYRASNVGEIEGTGLGFAIIKKNTLCLWW